MSGDIHPSHPDIVKRLRRAVGHLNKVVGMLEEQRPCLELAQQLYAVESAIREAKRALIRDHMDHCLERVVGPVGKGARAPIDEFKAIAKYL